MTRDRGEDNYSASRRGFLTTTAAAMGAAAGCTEDKQNDDSSDVKPTTSDTDYNQPEENTTEEQEQEPEEEITEEAEYWIDQSFEEMFSEKLMPNMDKFTQGVDAFREAYPKEKVQEQLRNNPDEFYGEIVMGGFSDMGVGEDHTYRGATNLAHSTNFVMHEVLDEEFQKDISPDSSDRGYAIPTSMVIDGGILHGVDIHTEDNLTVGLPSFERINKGQILSPKDKEDAFTGNGRRLSMTETKLADAFAEREDNHLNYRLENLTRLASDLKAVREKGNLGQSGVDATHMEYGKLVPGLYPPGMIPGNPPMWMAESGAERLRQQIGTNGYDGTTDSYYNGPDHVIELFNGFNGEVTKEQKGIVYNDNGSLAVEPVPEEDYEEWLEQDPVPMWAPEP
ncbi:hypothetical protein ACFR99_01510 [Haloarchaeobius amylolyticus]|uniref:Tat (Twin-arginine translocation) pathway signal sequence n=1 Tax=Haloarchaeobius amylolyticus TaxID=1198296 RepID=A0ABD6BCK7_9EURY